MTYYTNKEKTLIDFLLSRYKANFLFFCDIINQKTKLSLRLLDWLVTNYSKKYNVIYPLTNKNGEIRYFNIYLDYKNQLKAYSKKHFDPFCRQKRIIVNTKTLNWDLHHKNIVLDEDHIVTTVGQLNFFKWVIENKIFDYAMSNLSFIDQDMYSTLDSKNKNKRTTLSPSAINGGAYNCMHKITLKFKH